MSMAAVMSQMPDVWRRVLTEHVADPTGRCRACSATPGEAASWPCQTFKVAHHARGIATGEFPIPTLQPSLSRAHSPQPAPDAWPLEQPSHSRWDLDGFGRPDDLGVDRGSWESQPSWPAPRREARREPWDEGWSAEWSHDAGREPHRDSWGEAPRTFDRSYGSTMDAPYGSSFGVDDRRRHSW